jgi:hypothetical protein
MCVTVGKTAGIAGKMCVTAGKIDGTAARTNGTAGKIDGIAKKMFANSKEIDVSIEGMCPAMAEGPVVAKIISGSVWKTRQPGFLGCRVCLFYQPPRKR